MCGSPQMPPPPRMTKPNNIIIRKSVVIKTFEKRFPLVCRACWDKSIDINILHFDQYSCLAISLNIFYSLAINSKMNLKFEKKLSISL